MPLDPLNLTREASINRVAIIDLPSIELPADVCGQKAYELLSAVALSAAIKPHKAALGIADNTPDTRLLPALDRCLQSGDDAIREQADAIAAIFGVRLGCLLLTLKRGDTINRQARTEWDDSYWAHWATIQHVIIGGGINRRVLGYRIAQHAQSFLHQHSFPDITVERAGHAEVLPLIGAARFAPADTASALIFDFGQTHVKKAIAFYQDDNALASFMRARIPQLSWQAFYKVMAGLLVLVPSASECDTQNLYGVGDAEQARHRANFIGDLIENVVLFAEGLGLFDRAKSEHVTVMCSLASYVQCGQPADRGCYGVLGFLSDNVEQYFADRLSTDLGRPVTFRLMHDGTAAAAAYAGAEHAAVITMGTALGIGFPPPADAVHPLASDFRVETLKAYT